MTDKSEIIAEIRAIHRDLGVEEGQPLEHCDSGMLAGYLTRLKGKSKIPPSPPLPKGGDDSFPPRPSPRKGEGVC